jgi:uncharacterized membrane protein
MSLATIIRLSIFFVMGFLLKSFGLTFAQLIIIVLCAIGISIASYYEGANNE